MVESSRVQHFQRLVRRKSCICFQLTNRSAAVPKPAKRVLRPRDFRLTTATVVLALLKPNTALRLGVARRFPWQLEVAVGLLLPLRGERIRRTRTSRRRQKAFGLAGAFRVLSAG